MAGLEVYSGIDKETGKIIWTYVREEGLIEKLTKSLGGEDKLETRQLNFERQQFDDEKFCPWL